MLVTFSDLPLFLPPPPPPSPPPPPVTADIRPLTPPPLPAKSVRRPAIPPIRSVAEDRSCLPMADIRPLPACARPPVIAGATPSVFESAIVVTSAVAGPLASGAGLAVPQPPARPPRPRPRLRPRLALRPGRRSRPLHPTLRRTCLLRPHRTRPRRWPCRAAWSRCGR